MKTKNASSKLCSGLLALGLSLATIPALNANSIQADPADVGVTVHNNIDGSPSAETVRVGSSSGGGRAMIIPFLIPDLGLAQNPFESASFTFSVAGKSSALPASVSIALSALAARDIATVLGADYSASGTAIQASILFSNDPVGTYTTNPAGSASLVDFLNQQYAGGEGVGKYIFLRLKPEGDGIPATAAGYNIASANNSLESLRPFITYSPSIPEPATVATLLGGAVLLLLLARRMRKR